MGRRRGPAARGSSRPGREEAMGAGARPAPGRLAGGGGMGRRPPAPGVHRAGRGVKTGWTRTLASSQRRRWTSSSRPIRLFPSLARVGSPKPHRFSEVIPMERSRVWLLWLAQIQGDPYAAAVRVGAPIRYPYVHGEWPLAFYQTLFARVEGSAEMPSAARPFTCRVLRSLRARGVGIAQITLHTGVSSHELVHPVVEAHGTYPEWYDVPDATVQAIHAAKAAGGRVIAVGTTVVRAVESAAIEGGAVKPATGFTELFVHPDYDLKVVD